MKKPFYLFLFIFFITVSMTYGQIRPRDYLIMFDISGSMIGKGDGRGINIFDDVKKWAKAYIDEVNEGEILSIYPFDNRLKNRNGEFFQKVINSKDDLEVAKKFIESLQATGQNTFLTSSYESAYLEIKKFSELLPSYNQLNREQLILIYTDGKGNERPRDNSMDSLIAIYNLAKTDYEYLYTKFIFIGEVGLDIDREEVEKLKQNKIDITLTDRGKSLPPIVNIKPSYIKIFDYNPVFSVQLADIPDSLVGLKVSTRFNFEDQFDCLASIEPTLIELQKNKIYEFSVNLSRTGQCLEYIAKNNYKSIIGTFSINDSQNRVKFSPSQIEAEYNFTPIEISLDPYVDITIEDKGEVEIKVIGGEFLKEKLTLLLKPSLQNLNNIYYEIEPREIDLEPRMNSLRVNIEVIKTDSLTDFARQLEEEYLDTLVITASEKKTNDLVKIKQDKTFVPVIIKPKVNPLLYYIILILILIILSVFLLCWIKTAKFIKGARFEDDLSNPIGIIKRKFCRDQITIGDTIKDDIKITFSNPLNETFLSVSTYGKDGLKMVKKSEKIILLDKDSIESPNVVINPDESFYIKSESETKEIFYKIGV